MQDEASDNQPGIKSGDHLHRCSLEMSGRHRRLAQAVGLWTDGHRRAGRPTGLTKPGKDSRDINDPWDPSFTYIFGDKDGFVRDCQSYFPAVKARVAGFDPPSIPINDLSDPGWIFWTQ